jgi:outer membrane protein
VFIPGLLALLGVAYLFYSQTANKKPSENKADLSGKAASQGGLIAYFEMDSIDHQYSYLKEVRNQIKQEEERMSAELNNMKKSYMSRIQQLQSMAPNMSQQEGEQAQTEINKMQMNVQQKEASLGQELQEKQFKLMKEVNDKIMKFLTDYNKDKKYAYIISRTPGDFVFFADSTHNITHDVLRGLNEMEAKQKQ